jgi:hypothetical protein
MKSFLEMELVSLGGEARGVAFQMMRIVVYLSKEEDQSMHK